MTVAPIVQLWPVDLDAARVDSMDVLSADELVRADAFRFDRHRRRWIAGRVAVRRIVGARLGIPAAEVEFDYGLFGKPGLRVAGQFMNVSRSGPCLVLALSGVPIGIDIELAEPAGHPYDDQVARSYFHPQEYAELTAAPSDQRPAAFLRCWTRKEAYVKAKGGGLQLPLDRFAVSLAEGRHSALRWSRLDEPGERWSISDVSAELAPCVAALAVLGPSPTVSVQRAPELAIPAVAVR